MDYRTTLTDLNIDLPSLLLGAGAGFAVGAAVLLVWIFSLSKKTAALEAHIAAKNEGMDAHIRTLAQSALQSNAESFLLLAQEKLKQSQDGVKHDLDKRSMAIADMVKPVEKYLEQLKGSVDQLQGTDKAIREDLQNLSRETANLTGALRNPKEQGRWGEYILERILDKANLIEGIHYEKQKTIEGPEGRGRPDITISLQDGFKILIDSKAPLTEFMNRIDDVIDEKGRLDFNKSLAATVRNHIRALSQRDYQKQAGSPDFVILFLPSEYIFSSALSGDINLVDYAADYNVVIASPTVLLPMVRVVDLSYRQSKLAENAQNISRLGEELFERITTFVSHFDKVGKGVEAALEAYNKAVGTLETRVLVSARKLKDLHAAPANAELETPRLIESAARPLTAPQNTVDEGPETTDTDTHTKRYG